MKRVGSIDAAEKTDETENAQDNGMVFDKNKLSNGKKNNSI